MLPLEKVYHPELDTSKCLDQDGIQKHQSLIGATQCAVLLVGLDISTTVMTSVSFREDST